MIIVDTHTEYHLTAMLETWRTNAEERGRVIVVERSALPELSRIPATDICNRFAQHVKDHDSKAYTCTDGDILLTSTQDHLRYDMFQKFLLSVNALTGADITAHVHVYDVVRDLQPLRLFINQKSSAIAKARKEAEGIKQQLREEERIRTQEEQRQNILQRPFDADLIHSIGERRQARTQVEILIVEDDRFTQQLVQSILRKSFNVTGAENGNDALTAYITNPPDIVFLDINLPDIEGFDVLHKIKSADPDACIVMLSGNSDRDNIMRALQQGAKGFVGKPFTPKKLMEYVEKSPLVQKRLHPIIVH